jgi:RHS repeat-associated protein
VTLTRSYDSTTNQLTGITNRKPPAGAGTILSQFTFDYSIGSDKGDLVKSTAASDGTNTNTTAYTYDALNRLTRAVTTGPTVNQYFDYTLDANGNRTKQVVNLAGSTSTGATTTSYGYNAGNQLCWKYTGTSTNACGSTPSGATTYTFNQAGDETGASSGLSFSYNNAGQTTSVTPAGGSATSHSYLDGGQNEVTAVGSTTLQNGDLGVSSTIAGGSTTYYGRTPDGTLVDERNGSSRSWYVFGGDVLGSVHGVVNGSTGNWVASRTYTPYGETNATTGSDPNPFWFAAGYLSTTGLYHFGARHYDPATGRWTQRDPVSQMTDLVQANGYLYAADDPVNSDDAAGLMAAGPGAVCSLRNSAAARRACADHAKESIRRMHSLASDIAFMKKIVQPVVTVYHVGACVYKLARSGGADATACNSF